MFRFLAVTLLAVVTMLTADGTAQSSQTVAESKVRTYYVAADEVDWDYAPGCSTK